MLVTFSPFPTMFLKGFYFRVVKSRDCVVELNKIKKMLVCSLFHEFIIYGNLHTLQIDLV